MKSLTDLFADYDPRIYDALRETEIQLSGVYNAGGSAGKAAGDTAAVARPVERIKQLRLEVAAIDATDEAAVQARRAELRARLKDARAAALAAKPAA